MKTNLMKFIAVAGCVVLSGYAYAAHDPLDAGVHAKPAWQYPQHEQSRDIGKRAHDGQYRYAGGTGVGNPGTTSTVRPVPQGPVREPRFQDLTDRIRMTQTHA